MRVVARVMRVHGVRGANDLLVPAVPARDVDPDGDRLVRLVGDDDALTGLLDAGRCSRAGCPVRSCAAALCFARAAARSARRAVAFLRRAQQARGMALLRRQHSVRAGFASFGASTRFGFAHRGAGVSTRSSALASDDDGLVPATPRRISFLLSHCQSNLKSLSHALARPSAPVAISCFARRSPDVLSNSPVACWKRRPSRSRRAVSTCSRRSRSRHVT